MSTFDQKLRISAGSGFVFFLMNHPSLLTMLGPELYNSTTQCLTNRGVIVQVIIFAILTFLSMRGSYADTLTKISHTTYGALIFFFVSNPATYRVVSSILGENLVNANGCPTTQGIFLHTLVYIAALVGVMYFP